MSSNSLLQRGPKSDSINNIRAGLDRSQTDTPLAKSQYRLSGNSSGILDVSISQSPLLGMQISQDLIRRDAHRRDVDANTSRDRDRARGSNRQSGHFLMNVGMIDEQRAAKTPPVLSNVQHYPFPRER